MSPANEGTRTYTRDQVLGAERRALAHAETPAEGWWHKPECNCGLCRAPSGTTDAAEQSPLADGAMRLRRPRSPVPLSLTEVRDSDLPALLLDFGESLLYLAGEIFEVDASLAPLPVGSHPVPLPAMILARGVGIDYGWRHAGDCACRFCSKGGRPDAQEASAA